MWKLWRNAILTFVNIKVHHLHCEVRCPLCGYVDDLVNHTCLLCNFVKTVWFGLSITIKFGSPKF